MSKAVLLTTLYLLEFRESVGAKSEPIDVRTAVNRRSDLTVELKIGERYEVNAIIGAVDGKPVVPVWVIDYKAALDSKSTNGDLWKMSLVLDETYPSYDKAHDAIVELVDHLMTELESSRAVSKLEI